MIASTMSRRLCLAALLAVSVSACSTVPASMASKDARDVILERDLRGRTYAKGVFTNSITGSTRPFTVVLDGTVRGKTLTLREAFAYADGERDVKTWIITRTGPTAYTGTREDVIGPATIVQDGPIVRLGYEADVTTSSGAIRVRFEDVIERDAKGVIVNRAIVSKLGVPLGTVDLVFGRRPPR
ncbi:MAG: DUF3833 family protein [Bosea sp. (in: a-proteobacteria)]